MTAAFWTPEPIWKGATAYLLGGGPSLRDVDLTKLAGQKVIAINSSRRRAIEAGLDDGILFFTDGEWFAAHRDAVAAWRGLVVTSSSGARKAMPGKVKRVQAERRPDFPRPGAPVIRKGRSAGQTAIGMAVALGAVRVVLLGYDMRIVDGRSHHHDDYSCGDARLYTAQFLPAFKGWNEAAIAVGVGVVNASRGSALTEFQMVECDEALAVP